MPKDQDAYEMKHFGVLGMHWGTRRGSQGEAKGGRKQSKTNQKLDADITEMYARRRKAAKAIAAAFLVTYGAVRVSQLYLNNKTNRLAAEAVFKNWKFVR